MKRVEGMLPSAPVTEDLLADYSSLQNLSHSIKSACGGTEAGTGQSIKLVTFLEQLVDICWSKIKDVLSS